MELDSRQRQHLKGLAHHLKPIVHVGKDGLSNSLLQQIDAALLQHELIKVKLGESSPLDRKAAAAELPAKTGAAFVQNIGRVFVLFRAHPDEPRIELPLPRPVEDEGDSEAVLGDDAGPIGLPSVRQRGAMPLPPRIALRSPQRSESMGPPPRPKPSPAVSERSESNRRPKPRERVKKERAPRKSSKRTQHKRGSGRR